VPSKRPVLLTLATVYAVAGLAMGLAPDTPNAERGFEFVLSVVTMICVYV
jgi:hypothetical protein